LGVADKLIPRSATWMPVPDSATVCGLTAALSAKLSRADRDPVAEGVNLMCTVHDRPGLSVLPLHPSDRLEKSMVFAPAMLTPETTSGAVPLFVSVVVLAPRDVPTCCEPKSTLAGLSETAPPLG
jgi:hypothetical protein